jgi:hypothetical protein
MGKDAQLIGTWRLVTYETWNAEGTIVEPLGASPAGYAVFDAAGHAFIQLALRADTEAGPDRVAQSFVAYFGTYVIDAAAAELTIAVEASNQPGYVGSRQLRPYRIADDTLVLGIPGQYRATLRRASP